VTVEIDGKVVVSDNQRSLGDVPQQRTTGRIHQNHLKSFSRLRNLQQVYGQRVFNQLPMGSDAQLTKVSQGKLGNLVLG